MKRWGWIVTLCIALMVLSPLCAEGASKSTPNELPYRLEVDLTNQLVFAYSTEDDSVVRTMLCSTGIKAGWTPQGTFHMPLAKRFATERGPWHSVVGNDYARYATRIKGSILFHSVVYNRKSTDSLQYDTWEQLGEPASHGCVRLTPLDAQWIAYNCGPNTEVNIILGEEDPARKKIHDEIKHSLPAPDEHGMVGEWEPTLQPTPAPDTTALEPNSKGNAVKKLQTRLQALGFFSGKINGTYGEDTQIAVKQIEAALGKEETGIASIELQGYIYAENAPTGRYVALKKDDRGPAVLDMQRKLKHLGLFDGTLHGTFDKATVEAVKKFYEFVNLPVKSSATLEMQEHLAQWVQ